MYVDPNVALRELGVELARKYTLRINTLRTTAKLADLRAVVGIRCHQLKGERKGEWAINLTGFHRLIFTIVNEEPLIVRIEEISKHYGD